MDLINNIIKMNNNLETIDQDGNNIIHKLVQNYNSKILTNSLETLLEKGELFDLINSKNFKGDTPLHCAVKNNNQECAQKLINYGASVDIVSNKGYKIKWSDKQNKNIKGGGNEETTDKNLNKNIIGKRYL